MRNGLMRTGLGALLVGAALAGCSPDEGGPTVAGSCPPAEGLIVVVGAHRNVSAPDLPERLACQITSTIAAGQPIGVVAVDGDPHVVQPLTQYEVTHANPSAHEDDIAAHTNQLLATVRAAVANSDGADLLEAIAIAADSARAADLPNASVIVIHSGLTDTGQLRMTSPGMTGARGEDVLRFLRDHDALPDVEGFDITLVGMGYAVHPQPSLSQAQRELVTEIWVSVLSGAGAIVSVVPEPLTHEGPETTFTTDVVTFPEIPQPTFPPDKGPVDEVKQEWVFDDTSALGFHSNSDQFRDDAAAAAALEGIAEWLATDTSRRASVVGTTANAGTEEGRLQRSTSRANRVYELLISLGVDPDRVSTEGRGYIADPPEDGDPGKAALNRSVRITLTD